jgi:hypothetical protein
MTARAILKRLIALFPGFAEYWERSDNCFRNDDGSFTRCGVFAAFSHFFCEKYEELPKDELAELGQFLSECMESSDRRLADAAGTCFLENVAGERFDRDFREHLSGEALRFYSYWSR